MTLIVVTPPTVEPVTVAEACAWCRIDAAEQAANTSVLQLLIKAMREKAENITGRAFVQRLLQLNLDGWPESGGFELPQPPLVEVQSVKYTDEDNTLQTLSASLYTVDAQSEPGRIVPAWNAAPWPNAIAVPNSVRVLYVAGYPSYGSPSTDDYTINIPASLKLWMHARLATLYENREQLIQNNQVQIPRDFADGILDDLVLGSRVIG